MSMVNKNLIVTAGLAFTLALGGCSTSSQTTTTTSVSTDEGTTTTTTTTSKDESGTESKTTTTESTSQADANGGKVYTNDYFEIAFEPPANWTIVDASEAPTINSNFKALMNDAIPLLAAASDGDVKDAVLLSRVEVSDATKGKTAADRVNANAEADKKTMEDAGLKVTVNDATITLGTEELPAKMFELTAEDGTKSYCVQSAKQGEDGDFLDIIVISPKEENITQICTYFKGKA